MRITFAILLVACVAALIIVAIPPEQRSASRDEAELPGNFEDAVRVVSFGNRLYEDAEYRRQAEFRGKLRWEFLDNSIQWYEGPCSAVCPIYVAREDAKRASEIVSRWRRRYPDAD